MKDHSLFFTRSGFFCFLLCLAMTLLSAPCMAQVTSQVPMDSNSSAVFSVPILEKWVRETLRIPDGDIPCSELDAIEEIRFAGSTPMAANDRVEPNEFPMGGVMLFHEDRPEERVMGWDFYNLDDFAQFKNLRRLTIAGQQVTDISGIASLPLEELNLTYNHIADVSPLSDMRMLRRLVLAQNPVSDLKSIATLDELFDLDIGYTNIADLSPIGSLKGLANLNVQYCIDLKNLSPLQGMFNLEGLNIRGFSGDLSFLAKMDRLTYLCVTDISQEDLRFIEPITSLRGMDIRHCDPEKLNRLNLPQLTGLDLSDSTFDSLEVLRGCTALERVSALRLPLIIADVPDTLTELQTLELLGCGLMTDVSGLASLPSLREVTLPKTAEASFCDIAGRVLWQPSMDEQPYIVRTPDLATRMRRQSPNPWPRPCEAALAKPVYVPMEVAYTYNREIITDALLQAPSSLPNAHNDSIPYWTGMTAENKGGTDRAIVAVRYWFEDELKFLSENGFNFYRAFYDFSFISQQGNPQNVNLRALEEIDQLIAWGMQYGVHIQISISGLPNYFNSLLGSALRGMGTTNLIEGGPDQELFKQYWMLLARRYADIPNRYLDFELFAEPTYRGSFSWEKANRAYYKVMRETMHHIWEAEGGKDKKDRRILMLMTLEAFNDPIGKDVARLIREEGCVVTQHTGTPHWIGQGGSGAIGMDEYIHQPYLPPPENITWPVLYLPLAIRQTGRHDPLTLLPESGEFPEGTVVTLYAFCDSWGTLEIHADAQRILRERDLKAWTAEGKQSYSATLKNPAKEIVFRMPGKGEVSIALITVEVPGQEVARLVPHSIYRDNSGYTDLPTITIHNNGTASGKLYDGQSIYDIEIKPFRDKVMTNGGSYMLTEFNIGATLPVDLLKVIVNDSMGVLERNRIPWVSDCLWNVLQCAMCPGATLKPYADTPWFYDFSFIEMLKPYTGGPK